MSKNKKPPKRPRDVNVLGKMVVDMATGQIPRDDLHMLGDGEYPGKVTITAGPKSKE